MGGQLGVTRLEVLEFACAIMSSECRRRGQSVDPKQCFCDHLGLEGVIFRGECNVRGDAWLFPLEPHLPFGNESTWRRHTAEMPPTVEARFLEKPPLDLERSAVEFPGSRFAKHDAPRSLIPRGMLPGIGDQAPSSRLVTPHINVQQLGATAPVVGALEQRQHASFHVLWVERRMCCSERRILPQRGRVAYRDTLPRSVRTIGLRFASTVRRSDPIGYRRTSGSSLPFGGQANKSVGWRCQCCRGLHNVSRPQGPIRMP